MRWKQNSRLRLEEPQTQVRLLDANSSPLQQSDTVVSKQETKAEKFTKMPKQLLKARLAFPVGRVCRQQQGLENPFGRGTYNNPFHALQLKADKAKQCQLSAVDLPDRLTPSARQPKLQQTAPSSWHTPDPVPCSPQTLLVSSFAPHGHCCQQCSWASAAMMLAAAKQGGQILSPFGYSFHSSPGTHLLLLCLNTSASRGFLLVSLFIYFTGTYLYSFPFLPVHKLAVRCTFSRILSNIKSNSLPKFDLWVDL